MFLCFICRSIKTSGSLSSDNALHSPQRYPIISYSPFHSVYFSHSIFLLFLANVRLPPSKGFTWKSWTLGCIYLFALVFLFWENIYPRVGLLDHMITLFLLIWETSIWFPTVGGPIYIPTNSDKGSLCSTSSPTFAVCVLFDAGHSNSFEVTSDYGFNWNFPDDKWWRASFHMLLDLDFKPDSGFRRRVV